MRRVRPGQPLLAAYTTHSCNSHVLFNYGFVQWTADGDCAYLTIGMPETTVHRAEKVAALQAGGVKTSPEGLVFHVKRGGELGALESMAGMLATARLSAMDAEYSPECVRLGVGRLQRHASATTRACQP